MADIETNRQQPYSTYAVHLTTLTHWALLWDLGLCYLLWKGTEAWDERSRKISMAVLFAWIFLSKFIKNMGHYIRYPQDIFLLPVSWLFGYFHSVVIKTFAGLTLFVVSATLQRILSCIMRYNSQFISLRSLPESGSVVVPLSSAFIVSDLKPSPLYIAKTRPNCPFSLLFLFPALTLFL